MKKHFFIFILVFVQNFVFGQKNFLDQPYIETSAKADTLITPDRIYLNIRISEADSKNKKSVEKQEKELEKALKSLNINTEKDLTLLDLSSNFKSYFLKGQNVLKAKQYELLVKDAKTAGKVLVELEKIGISNVNVTKVEYFKKEELLLELKSKAVAKTKKNAQKLAKALGQKVGKAVFISDENIYHQNSYEYDNQLLDVAASAMSESAEPTPISIDFQKIMFEARVSVKYILE